MTTIFLKPKKEESLKRFHPWIFSGAIQRIDGKPAEGDIVEVLDSNGVFLAIGPLSVICSLITRLTILTKSDSVNLITFFILNKYIIK